MEKLIKNYIENAINYKLDCKSWLRKIRSQKRKFEQKKNKRKTEKIQNRCVFDLFKAFFIHFSIPHKSSWKMFNTFPKASDSQMFVVSFTSANVETTTKDKTTTISSTFLFTSKHS